MTTVEDIEMTEQKQDPEPETNADGADSSEPTMLDHWRFERRVSTPEPAADWRSGISPELLARVRAKSANKSADKSADTSANNANPAGAATEAAAEKSIAPAMEAAQVKLPESYRAPYLPDETIDVDPVIEALNWQSDAELLPVEADVIKVPTAFQGLDGSWDDDKSRVLVSVRPILDAAMAEKVAELLTQAPGMSSVRSLGSAGDIAAFEAEYRGSEPGMEVVSHALQAIGASLVSTGDREFYLAIQGQSI